MIQRLRKQTAQIIISLILVQTTLLFSTQAQAGFPQDFSDVVWLHTNVSAWKQTSVLKSVSTGSSSITLDYDKTRSWPGKVVTSSSGGAISVNANPWIFVKRDGKWYGATFEWMKPGQVTKNKAAVKGDHIKLPPLNNFVPRVGEIYGFMVSGLARTSLRNVEERSNVVLFKWEGEMVSYCTTPPDINYFRSANNLLRRPQNVGLSWNIDGADSASITPKPGSVHHASGDVDVYVKKTTTFTLTAKNDCGTSSRTKKIDVQNLGMLNAVLSSLLGG